MGNTHLEHRWAEEANGKGGLQVVEDLSDCEEVNQTRVAILPYHRWAIKRQGH